MIRSIGWFSHARGTSGLFGRGYQADWLDYQLPAYPIETIVYRKVMREGFLDQPDPGKVVPDAVELVRQVRALEGVAAVSPRVLAEGLLVNGRELASVDLIGVEPEAVIAVGVGGVVAAGIEAFGRIHGWPMAWVGLDPRTLEELALSGVAEDTTFHAHLPRVGALLIGGGVYLVFLATGLWAALKVGRLEVLEALRSR
jgi:ABC-type lipoprotein release transport system permease subunit